VTTLSEDLSEEVAQTEAWKLVARDFQHEHSLALDFSGLILSGLKKGVAPHRNFKLDWPPSERVQADIQK
jgi:hypothetical protein